MVAENIVLSIKPRYSKLIFSGAKTVELRRTWPAHDIRRVVVYESAPTKEVVGIFDVTQIVRTDIMRLYVRVAVGTCIGNPSFLKYFHGLEYGYGICISNAVRFSTGISTDELSKLLGAFLAPQQWRYIFNDELDKLYDYSKEKECCCQ